MTQIAPTPGNTTVRMDVPENIARLTPYSPGKPIEEVQRELGLTRVVKLASNENPLGPSPQAIKAIADSATRVHLYPDAASRALRQALAGRLHVSPESLVIGNGSDDIIHLLGVTFLRPGDEVVQGDPSFVRYEAAALLNNALCHRVPLTPDWVHDLEAMAARCNARTRLVFIANPNNPTGTIVGRDALLRLLDRMPEGALLVLDEAYYEYAAGAPEYPDGVDLVREGRNVVVLRTFSKAYGLAGLRVGYGVMHPDIAQWLHRTREPFNVNLIAQVAARAALEDVAHVRRTIEVNEEGKQAFYSAFRALGLEYTPTFANFVWVDLRRECRPVYEALLQRGVITRTGDIFGAPTYLRVTIGTPEENALFLSALRHVLQTGA
ncbi:MAG: histidinol-phosphate transaminase [Chloroherpetonaceae bacterium]|nr:histidinol-phosphate transaminase [Chthonomonadaceae bacterium]MDW8207819.1 histidinol-phosphate transaminase [Chloroherpetonaceae bacterium]